MSSTAVSIEEQVSQADNEPQTGLPWGNYLKAIAGLAFIYTVIRVYMHSFAYSVGLDYFEPEFATYWMTAFWVQVAVLSIAFCGIMGWLWHTRERDFANLAPEVELTRYYKTVTWFVSYTAVVMILGPLAGESDAAWHQVVIRDTDFTPTHISLFYFGFPMLIITGVGTFLYAKTRLPLHSKQTLVPLGIAIGGPLLVMPTVGLNEWGHTFFYAEELFGAPIHWGFAFLGLALLALGGVLVHLVSRMRERIDIVAEKPAH